MNLSWCQGDKVEHKLQEDEANDGAYEQIGGNTVAQSDDEMDVDLDASPEASPKGS
jgi:hypothetical protein